MIVEFVLFVFILVVAAVLWWFSKPVRQSFTNPPASSYRHVYRDPKTGEQKSFPSIFEPAGVELSLVVPAYNEEKRIQKMLDETVQYLQDRRVDYEIIVVDDGSKDKTSQVSLEYTKKLGTDRLRVMTLKENQGKGGAVQQGILHARGKYILMVDADAATEIKDLDRLRGEMRKIEDRKGMGVVVGSRAHMQEEATAKRKWYRSILMHGFHLLVYILAVKTIKDTQCGFKLFSRNAARILFSNLKLRRWCFDVEILHIAEALSIPLKEVAVNWQEVPGSKLKVLEASILMGRDLVVIRACYMLGIWTIKKAR
mmetsp:Transcript_9282/g.13929  ORF Transcript_9282/g.13929 Transcript_9282/m.13929 type:complete len:312 (+) Transcript_9282:92-1027(+)